MLIPTAFLAAKGWLGLKNQWWLLIVFAIATISATAITIAKNRDDSLIDTAKEAGANDAIVAGQNDILNQVEQANNAQNEIDSGDADAAFKRCMSNATAATRASCDRFRTLPD